MYIANHYIHHDGRIYGRGECIPGLSADQAAWLTSIGAVTEKAAPEAEPAPKAEPEKAPVKRTSKKKGVKAE